ncbi:MAG: hypothetical protein ACMXYG_05980 [Candidatus Woesearchaeota archaeon]
MVEDNFNQMLTKYLGNVSSATDIERVNNLFKIKNETELNNILNGNNTSEDSDSNSDFKVEGEQERA